MLDGVQALRTVLRCKAPTVRSANSTGTAVVLDIVLLVRMILVYEDSSRIQCANRVFDRLNRTIEVSQSIPY